MAKLTFWRKKIVEKPVFCVVIPLSIFDFETVPSCLDDAVLTRKHANNLNKVSVAIHVESAWGWGQSKVGEDTLCKEEMAQ